MIPDNPYSAPSSDSSPPLEDLAPIARFHSAEEADALAGELAAAGCEVEVVEPGKGRDRALGFDASLGAFNDTLPFTLVAPRSSIEHVSAALDKLLTIEEGDPLLTLSRAELRALADEPLNGNLPDQVLARRLLLRDPLPAGAPEPEPQEVDRWEDADNRTGRVIAGFGIIGAVPSLIVVILAAVPAADHPPILLPLWPLITGVALVVSSRTLPGGRVRAMFDRNIRLTGLLCMVPALLGVALLLLLLFLR